MFHFQTVITMCGLPALIGMGLTGDGSVVSQ